MHLKSFQIRNIFTRMVRLFNMNISEALYVQHACSQIYRKKYDLIVICDVFFKKGLNVTYMHIYLLLILKENITSLSFLYRKKTEHLFNFDQEPTKRL